MPRWTKRQIVNKAYTDVGYASYEFDLEPEELQDGMDMLDMLIAEWSAKGIHIGYSLPSTVDGDIDTETGVPDWAARALYSNLALELAPSLGKMATPTMLKKAKSSYRLLLQRSVRPQQMQYPGTLPSGAGNKSWRYFNGPFVAPPNPELTVDNDDTIEFE